MHIRRYQPEDKETVRDLHIRGLASAGIIVTDGPWSADLDDIENAYLSGGEFLVGTIEGKIVAMGALQALAPDRGEIKRMRTEPALQSQGYGQQIFSLLEQRAREFGFRILELSVAEINRGAQRFYKKNDYQEVRRGFIGPYPMIWYEKIL